MINRLNIVLAFLLVSVCVLLVSMQVDHSQPNYQVNLGDDMTYSPAYTSFEVNDIFPNGRTLQEPVPGTIARDIQPFHFEATPEDAIRAGEQLANPFDPSTDEGLASVARGAAAFQIFCTACHGADGTGNGPVAKRGFPPPPSLLIGKSREMKDGQLFHILTYGQNSMPQFAAQLPPQRRWDLINHIRNLQHDAKPPAETEEVPATPAPEDEQEPSPEVKPETASEVEQEAALSPETSENTPPDSDVPADTEEKT